MALGNGRKFFVESYVPGLDAARAAAISSRLRTAVEQLQNEGLSLTWTDSFALLDEDTYVWIVEVAEADHVVLLQRRAGIQLDHVVEIVSGADPGVR